MLIYFVVSSTKYIGGGTTFFFGPKLILELLTLITIKFKFLGSIEKPIKIISDQKRYIKLSI